MASGDDEKFFLEEPDDNRMKIGWAYVMIGPYGWKRNLGTQ